MRPFRRARIVLGLIAALLLLALPQRSAAFIEAAYSLGKVCNDSTNILVIQVEKVDKQKNLIIYRKVEDLKGKHDGDVIRHNIGKFKLHNDREWTATMEWAEPGKRAVMFHNGNQSETCIGHYWYQTYRGEWWTQTHGEPFMCRSFCGKIEKLIAALRELHAGREVVVPCMVGASGPPGTEQCRGPKPTAEEAVKLEMGTARIQRLKVSLKQMDYDAKRDFVGWGDEDFRRLQGMPGFTHYSGLPRVDPEAQAISVVDFDNDGKPDLCLVGAGRLVLLNNGEDAMNEVSLPQMTGGARAAVWADYNGDGLPDLLLATPTGPRLFTNLGKGNFRDDSHLLPKEPRCNLTAAAWIDYDGDGRPDILLATGFSGLRLYRNTGAVNRPAPPTPAVKGQPPTPAITWGFEDVSAKVGLGPDGLGSTVKGDTLTVCDVNGDGRPDVLYGAGTGMLLLNTPGGFVEAKDSGIKYKTGKVGPVFGDFDNSGVPSLLVPQLSGGCKLFKNDGKGHFTDVTAKSGDLAKFTGTATCAAWGDVDNDGHLDLVVGCLRGPNRFFRNKGDGTFEDATEAIGLHQKIYNTQAIALVDLNNDGVLDMVFNNVGQESCILLGSRQLTTGKRTPLTLTVKGTAGVLGSRVRVLDPAGKTVATRQVGGGAGRGGQEAALARFALQPGAYRVEIRYSSGAIRTREVTVADSPLRTAIDDN